MTNHSALKVLVGSSDVSFEGRGDFCREICHEISSFPGADSDAKPDILYRVYTPANNDPGQKGQTVCFEKHDYTVAVTPGPPIVVSFCPKRHVLHYLAHALPAGLFRAVTSMLMRTSYSYGEFLSASFFYNVFMPVNQSVMVEKGEAYLHAGAVADRDDSAYLFTGESESGKSLTIHALLQMEKENGYKILSDDAAIIASQGKTYLNAMHAVLRLPIWCSLKKSVACSPESSSFSRKGPILISGCQRKDFWVARRLPLSELYDADCLGKEAVIKSCFRLVQVKGSEVRLRERDPADFIAREIKGLRDNQQQLLGYICKAGNRWTPEELTRIMGTIYAKALGRARCFDLSFPLTASPRKLGAFAHHAIAETKHRG